MIHADYTTTADYSAHSYFPVVPVEYVHNLILIPSEIFPELSSISLGDSVTLLHKKRPNVKLNQSVVLECGNVNIFNKNYYYFYIGIGIRISSFISLAENDYELYYGDKHYPLNLVFNNQYSGCKLLVGALVLPDNYNYCFNQKDQIGIYTNNQIHTAIADNILNRANVYFPLKMNTIILPSLETHTSLLSLLNSRSTTKEISVRSLTTKPNMTLGTLDLNIYEPNTTTKGVSNSYSYTVDCVGIYHQYTNRFYTDNTLKIKDLPTGKYYVSIRDRDNRYPELINKRSNNNQDLFVIEIVDSAEQEYSQMIQHYIAKGEISPESIKNVPPLRKLQRLI